MSGRLPILLALAALAVALLAAAPTASAGTCPPVGSYDPAGASGTDPLRAKQWGLDQINAPAAWARGVMGGGAVIAVLDTGVDLGHPDLQANLVPGADMVDPDDSGCPGPQDEEGHGTHVAGIAAAVTFNGHGVAGTAPGAKIMPIRVLDAEGSGSVEDIAAGMKLAADRGAKVLNLSLGGDPIVGQAPPLNEELEEAAAYAWSKGAIVVAAAGNETFPLCSYPAAAKNAICVSATDRRGLPTFYGNFPVDDDAVGVRAPGGILGATCEEDEDIWSTIWPGSSSECNGSGEHSGYETLAGTSMASPYVAGVAALLAGAGLSNEQILECIRDNSSNKGTFDPVRGYGTVDADAATAACVPASSGSVAAPAGSEGSSPRGVTIRDAAAPAVKLGLSRTSLRKLVRTGKLRVAVRVNEPAGLALRAYTSRRSQKRTSRRTRVATLATRRLTVRRTGRTTVTLRLTRTGRRVLRGRERAVITVLTAARDAAGNATTSAARRTYR